MARPSKGPRIWLRPARPDGTAASWFILDKGKQFGTGCGVEDQVEAESLLLDYIQSKPTEGSTIELFMYFATADVNDFPIKIGISASPKIRMSTLQVGLPYTLKLLVLVKIKKAVFETRVHRKFAHLRLRGEWFQRHPEILEYMNSLAAIGNLTNETPILSENICGL